MAQKQRILVIDDEIAFCELISTEAQALGVECASTSDPQMFFAMLAPEVTLIVMDLMMPGMDGIELLRKLAERECKVGIVLMSGVGMRILETAQALAEALGLSIVGHLLKPFRLSELDRELRKNVSQTVLSVAPDFELPSFEAEELCRAIEDEEFVLHYEPQMEIASGKVFGVEAVVRWQHPEQGLVYPSRFIPQIVELGLLDKLGWIVLRRGMREITMFVDSFGYLPRLSVKASMRSIHDLSFPDKLEKAAKNYDFPLNGIALEITESGYIQELSHILDVLTRLRMKSVQLSIDDFGTGFSLMEQLRHIPATELKIDQSFVQNIGRHDQDQVMVLKTIEIGHELGMTVVAEGVESAAQLTFLRENRCDLVQGGLFSGPLAPNLLADWFVHYRTDMMLNFGSEKET